MILDRDRCPGPLFWEGEIEMANIHCNYYSDALKLNTDINVVIPTPNSDELMNNKDTSYWHPGAKYQVLYLLHGTYGDYSDWCHLTSIEKYAQNHKIMVVMPSVANSFYQDMVIGPKYLTFLTEELPQYIQMLFPASGRREDNFVADLSMGGYGAWHVALAKPEQYAAAASLSGALSFPYGMEENLKDPASPWPFRAIFEDCDIDKLANSEVNLLFQIKKLLAEGKKLPELFMTVGTEDFTYGVNQQMRHALEELKVPFTYEEHPGIHDWDYWDAHIQRALDWMPLANTTV